MQAHERRSVYVTAAAACKSGTLGFGDGNGYAPPGLRKPAPGLGIGVVSTPDERPEKREVEGGENTIEPTFKIPVPNDRAPVPSKIDRFACFEYLDSFSRANFANIVLALTNGLIGA